MTAAALTVLCTVALTSAPAAAADTDTPTLTGTLRTPAGEPIADALITVSVEPSADALAALPAGAEVQPTEVGWGWSWADGSFNTWIADTATLLAAKDTDGLISLVLTAPTDRGQVFYRSRVVVGADGVMRPFADDVAASAEERQVSASAMSLNSTGSPAFDLVASQIGPSEQVATTTVENGSDCPAGKMCATGAALDATETSAVARTDRPIYNATVAEANAQTSSSGRTFEPDVWCRGNYWYLRKSKDIVGRNVTLADQYTAGSTNASIEYRTSKETSLEIGVTNRGNALVATLGMSKGKTTTATISGTIAKNTKAEWWASFDFNMYDVMCGSTSTGQKWWSGYTEYRPKGFAGDFSRRLWTPFACNTTYRTTFGPNVSIKIASDRTTTRSGAFAFGGSVGNLKATQKWSSGVSTGYSDASGRGFNLCGKGGKWNTGVTKTREVA